MRCVSVGLNCRRRPHPRRDLRGYEQKRQGTDASSEDRQSGRGRLHGHGPTREDSGVPTPVAEYWSYLAAGGCLCASDLSVGLNAASDAGMC